MFTAAAVAGVCFTLAALLLTNLKRFKRKDGSLKFAAILMLIGGFGVGGLIGRWMRDGGIWITEHLSELGNQLIGVGVPLLVAIALIGKFGIDMSKGHKPTKFTPWIALLQFPIAAPLLPGAAGDNAAGAGEHVFAAVQSFLTSIF